MESSPSHEVVAHPVVDALVAAAQQREPARPPPAPGPWPGRGVRPPGPSRNSGPGRLGGLDGGEDRLGHQHHAGAAAERACRRRCGARRWCARAGRGPARRAGPVPRPGRAGSAPANPETMSGKMVKTSMRTTATAQASSSRSNSPSGTSTTRRPVVVAADDEHAAAPARRCRAPAGRWPGCPARPRRRPGRCRRRSTTGEPMSSCTQSVVGVGRSSGSARSTAPRSSSAVSRLVTPSKCTIQRSWCGRDAATTRRPVAGDEHRRPGRGAEVSVGGEGDHDLAPEARGPWSIRPTSRQASTGAQSTNSTSTSTPSRAAAARTTVRIDWATRPRLPMTRPMSPAPTCTLSTGRRPRSSTLDARRRRGPRPAGGRT